MKRYNIVVEQYGSNYKLESNTNSIQFVNTGTSNCIVNRFTLLPNQSFTITGNENEIDTTQYYITFSGAGVNQVTVIKKLYV